jgi:hypothetical protein
MKWALLATLVVALAGCGGSEKKATTDSKTPGPIEPPQEIRALELVASNGLAGFSHTITIVEDRLTCETQDFTGRSPKKRKATLSPDERRELNGLADKINWAKLPTEFKPDDAKPLDGSQYVLTNKTLSVKCASFDRSLAEDAPFKALRTKIYELAMKAPPCCDGSWKWVAVGSVVVFEVDTLSTRLRLDPSQAVKTTETWTLTEKDEKANVATFEVVTKKGEGKETKQTQKGPLVWAPLPEQNTQPEWCHTEKSSENLTTPLGTFACTHWSNRASNLEWSGSDDAWRVDDFPVPLKEISKGDAGEKGSSMRTAVLVRFDPK